MDFVLSKINLAVCTRAAGTQAPVAYEMPPEVVREAISPDVATALSDLKKSALAKAAEERLAGKGWLPSSLRVNAS